MSRKAVLVATVLTLSVTSGIGVVASRQEPVVRLNVYVGHLDLGGLTREEARKRLRVWWESARVTPITIRSEALSEQPNGFFASSLGVVLDDEASVMQLPTDHQWKVLMRQAASLETERARYQPVLRLYDRRVAGIRDFVKAHSRPGSEARVFFRDGRVVRQYERTGVALDEERLVESVGQAVLGSFEIDLPLTEAPKTVPDDQLHAITDEVASFTTRYRANQVNRTANLVVGARKLDGKVLLPGQVFSFNEFIGRRDARYGYKPAGVFVRGRLEDEYGGGICQVVSTLYVAALLANLEIVERVNHSVPVDYVPLGQDATISYGRIDFRFRNSFDHPIAIATSIGGGRLTVRVLGRKDPGLEVKLERVVHDRWSHETEYVHDGTLTPGRQRVLQKGGVGARVTTFRSVYRNGERVSRERLGLSVYRGGPRVVAVNQGQADPLIAQAPLAEPYTFELPPWENEELPLGSDSPSP